MSELYTAETIVPGFSSFVVEISIEKLKRHKSPGIDQLRQNTLSSEIHKLIDSISAF
jgi:hypothetical protein